MSYSITSRSNSRSSFDVNSDWVRFKEVLNALPYELFFLVWKTVIKESCYFREMVQLIRFHAQLDDILAFMLREGSIELIADEMNVFLKLKDQEGEIKLGTRTCDNLISFVKQQKIKFPKGYFSSSSAYEKSGHLAQLIDLVSTITINHTTVHSLVHDFPRSKYKITEVEITPSKRALVGEHLHSYRRLPNLQAFNITTLCNEVSFGFLNVVLQFVIRSDKLKSVIIMLVPSNDDGIPRSLTLNIQEIISKRPSLSVSLRLMKNPVNHTDIDFDQFLQQTKLLKPQISALSSHLRISASVCRISEYENLDNLSLGMDMDPTGAALTQISSESFSSPKLKLLALQHWLIKGVDFFSNLPNLRTLALTSCNVNNRIKLPPFISKIVLQKCKFSNIITFPQSVRKLDIIASNDQELPRIHELPSQTNLQEVSLKLSFCSFPQDFLVSLPPTLRSLDVVVSAVPWKDLNFSFLKHLQEFAFSAYGYGIVFNLECLPPHIKKLKLDVRDASYKNTLPKSLKTFIFITNTDKYTALLNHVCSDCELDSLTVHSPNLSHNFLNFNFKQLKHLYIHADCQDNPDVFSIDHLILLLPKLPPTLYRLEFLIPDALDNPSICGLDLRLTEESNKRLSLLGFFDIVAKRTFI